MRHDPLAMMLPPPNGRKIDLGEVAQEISRSRRIVRGGGDDMVACGSWAECDAGPVGLSWRDAANGFDFRYCGEGISRAQRYSAPSTLDRDCSPAASLAA
jgi:hypothetical protein